MWFQTIVWTFGSWVSFAFETYLGSKVKMKMRKIP